MTAAWAAYPGAPPVGTTLAKHADIPDPGTLSVEVAGFPVLLARVNGHIHAYVNACPHQFLPLDYRSAQVLSADATILRCTNHAAGFCVETGQGVDGLGQGYALDPIPVTQHPHGMNVIARS